MTEVHADSFTDFDQEPQNAGGGFLTHLPAIFWQRRWLIIIPLALGLIASLAAALILPSVYRASALMLVQSAQLPADFTDSANSEIVDRRIARIREQITSRPDLISLIEKHSLYRGERNRAPLSDLVARMRDNITLTPTVANASGARSDQRTIAFELAFNYEEPAAAQAVVQDLLNRLLELDATGNATRSVNTVQFLTEQATALETQISALQKQIAAITLQNGGVLGRGGIAIMGGGTGGYDIQIAQLEREIATLTTQKETLGTSDTRDPAVVGAEAQLASARAIYAETHPDVVIAKQRLAQAQEFARDRKADLPVNAIDQQIAFSQSQLAALRATKAQEQSQVAQAVQAQARAPAVQNQIGDLQQQLAALNDQYKTASDRLLAAKATARADDQQMGERLLVVDPPVIPDSPVKPNRPLLVALGIVGGFGFGILLALAVEVLFSPIRDPGRLAAITGAAPIGIIPVIGARANTRASRRRRTFAFWRRGRRSADE